MMLGVMHVSECARCTDSLQIQCAV